MAQVSKVCDKHEPDAMDLSHSKLPTRVDLISATFGHLRHALLERFHFGCGGCMVRRGLFFCPAFFCRCLSDSAGKIRHRQKNGGQEYQEHEIETP